jgi:Smg protein
MFDILVYLFENYVHADACPEPAQLARKLTAAGFEEEEITEALEWLSGLRQLSDGERPAQFSRAGPCASTPTTNRSAWGRMPGFPAFS